jgi:hypothetical protein
VQKGLRRFWNTGCSYIMISCRSVSYPYPGPDVRVVEKGKTEKGSAEGRRMPRRNLALIFESPSDIIAGRLVLAKTPLLRSTGYGVQAKVSRGPGIWDSKSTQVFLFFF